MRKCVIGTLAHVDAGKTTLTESLLYLAGSIRVRGITIFSKQSLLRYKDVDMTLIDTPGHVDFSAEMERTLQILDYAIIVISGLDGVQAHTETIWNLLNAYHIPTFLFINKMDISHYEKSDYRPSDYYTKNPMIQKAVEFITGPQMMEIGKKENLERLSSELKNKDWFMTFLDLEDYIRTKERALEDYTDRKTWAKKMLVNISNAGFFSSDRTIREYNQDIWKLGD